MKKLVFALCSIFSASVFAEVKLEQYNYAVQVVSNENGKVKLLNDFSTSNIENEPVVIAQYENYFHNNFSGLKCPIERKVQSKLNSVTSVSFYPSEIKAGTFISLIPEIQSNGKIKIEVLFKLSDVNSINYIDNSGCYTPTYNMNILEYRNIHTINIGEQHKFQVNSKYELAIKIDKKKN